MTCKLQLNYDYSNDFCFLSVHMRARTHVCMVGSASTRNMTCQATVARRQKFNPACQHAAVCINIEKSMVTRDVGVPPQQQPMDALVRPYHSRHESRDPRLSTRRPACLFRSELPHCTDVS